MENTMDRLMLAAALLWMVALSTLLPAAAHAADRDDDDSAQFGIMAPAAPTGLTAPVPPTEPNGLVTPAPLAAPTPALPKMVVPTDFGGRSLDELTDHGTRVLSADEIQLDDRYDDVFAFGGTIESNGFIEDHLFATGGTVVVDGYVGSDVFAAAGEVVVNGTIAGDLYASAGELTINEGAHIGGKVMGGIGTIQLDGRVDGDLTAGAGEVIVTGIIGGDVDAEVGRLVLEDGALVGGKLNYVSSAMAEVDDGATIGGGTAFEEAMPKVADEDDSAAIVAFFRTWGAGASLVLGGLFFFAGGPLTRKALETARDDTAHRLGLGFAVMLAVPALAGVLGMFIVPLPVSFLLMVLLCIGMWFGRIVAAGALGDFLLRKAGQDEPNPYLALAVGLFILLVATSVPVLGFLVGTAATLVGLGALFATARDVRAAA